MNKKEINRMSLEEIKTEGRKAIEEINNKNIEKEKLQTLIRKTRKLIKTKKSIAEFNEPVMMLIRRNGEVEITEDAKEDTFKFTHSNGKEAEIYLKPSQQLRFPYAGSTFRGYICYEDEVLPLPQNPLMEVETMQIVVDKIMHDMKSWRASELLARGKMWKMILIGIAVILAVFIGLPILAGLVGVDTSKFLPWMKPAANVTQIIAQNASTIANGTTTILT